MLFPAISIQSIRSSNQRGLIAHWNMLAADRRFPAIDAFSPQAKDHNPEQLLLWDVERTGDDSGRRFRIRRLGQRAAETLGTGLIGKTMDEVVPESLRAVSLEGAHECAASGCAVYSVITTIANGHQVDCERLLLPFGGGGVEQIVASLQLISFQGPIQRQDVTRDFETRCHVSLSGKISSDWAARNPAATGAPAEHAAAAKSGRTDLRSDPQSAADAAPASNTPRGADNRKAIRRKVIKTGKIFFGKSREICTIRDMSATGASIEVANAAVVPDKFTLVLEMESASRLCAAVWRKDRQIGVRFG